MGTARKRRIADRVFGSTVDYVLRNAPCEVLVNLVPRGYPTEGSGDEDDLAARGDEDDQPTPGAFPSMPD